MDSEEAEQNSEIIKEQEQRWPRPTVIHKTASPSNTMFMGLQLSVFFKA